MKTLLTLLAMLIAVNFSYAQNSPTNQPATGIASGDNFIYQGNTVSFYGLGWYRDSGPDSPPAAYLSAYNGIKFFTEGAARGFLDVNGNLGIGTLTPTQKLNVDPGGAGGILIGNSNNGSNGYTSLLLSISASQNGYSQIQSVKSAGSAFGSLVLNGLGGNVLIGQSTQNNPGYKLDVAGSIRANQITVNTTGADFVFEPSYQLKPLSEIKQYIDQNHHLPEIASAKEMQIHGLNVGEHQIKLLQKVEELTLYLIKKDEELSKEHAENQKQQTQIDQLKQQLETLTKEIRKK